MVQNAYIYDAIRTPRGKGKPDGSLYEVKPVALGAGLLTELQSRYDLDTSLVEDVIIGCNLPEGEHGGVIAKSMAQYAGWDEKVAGVQVDRFCGSGVEALNMGAARIMAGWEQLMVVGGVQSLSRWPEGGPNNGPWIEDMETSFRSKSNFPGICADFVSTLEGQTREEVDAYSLESQKRAAHAQASGYFSKSVVPVKDINGMTLLDHEEHIKADTTMEKLASLKPSFEVPGIQAGFDELLLSKYPHLERINHIHTPGSSSGIVDGASAILIGSEQIGKDLDLAPRARIVAGAVTSTDPSAQLLGPGPATMKCLATAGLKIEDIDLFEVNEAFASVPLRYMRETGVPHEIVNVNGGAIAMGHPAGATGAMLVGTLLDELERRKLKRGLVTLCVGGGQGVATIIERL